MKRPHISTIYAGVFVGLLLLLAAGLQLHTWLQRVPPQAAHLSATEYQVQKAELGRRLQSDGAADSLAYARQQIAVNPSFARDCHPLLHTVGYAAYTYYGSFAAAMQHADEVCNSGYVHGLIEARFAGVITISDVSATAKNTCPATDAETFTQWECYHGVGHGIMLATDRDVTQSLMICRSLVGTFASSACDNGVFMEAFIGVDHLGNRLSPVNVPGVGLCRSQASSSKADCYTYAPTAFLTIHDGGYADAVRDCQTSAESQYLPACVSGVGSEAMKNNVTNPAYAAGVCKRLSTDQKQWCVGGAIGLYMNYHGSSAAAHSLCSAQFAFDKIDCLAEIARARQALQF